jgi:acetyl-CoA carboxylase biotin carboxylase subunit
VRWDSAVEKGYRIPPYYDSMVGKLIVHGPDRETTLGGSRAALESLRIEGVPTTRDLHLRILEHPRFQSGEYDVDFLPASGLVGER